MAASLVPVIYDLESGRVLRWFMLDHDGQLADPAWKPKEGEGLVNVPMAVYRKFDRSQNGYPALDEIQRYVFDNLP